MTFSDQIDRDGIKYLADMRERQIRSAVEAGLQDVATAIAADPDGNATRTPRSAQLASLSQHFASLAQDARELEAYRSLIR